MDSTSLGEELDAESLRGVLDDYFDAMRSVLERHGGVVEKFIGDAVMAVFGLPRMHEDDALRAVRAAIEMRDHLAVLNQHLSDTWGVALRNRTGVNTGVVVVGDASEGQRLATGDTVNVAARLEQAAPAEGVVLGPETFGLVKGHVQATSIGPLSLKGKSQTIEAWRLLTLEEENGGVRAERSERPLVGREAELAEIEARFNLATRNCGLESVLIVGDPGVGKSRLVRESSRRLAASATVLNAACRPYGSTSFWPIGELLSGVLRRPGPLDRTELELIAAASAPHEDRAAVVERVASILGLNDRVFPLEESFWATAKLFASVSPERALVLVIEDLHWAEESLLDMLDHFRMFPHPVGTLILATARPELLQRRYSGEVPSHRKVLNVLPLAAAESDQLIDTVLGFESLSRVGRSLVHRASEGNPLFVEQVLATWIEEGVLSRTVAGWTVSPMVAEVKMPASIAAIIAARLDRLPSEERLVLGAGSVVGHTFDRRALQPMLLLDHTTLDDCVQRLVRSRLLVPFADTTDADNLAFEHASLRDVAYDMTLKSDRAAFHERLAAWIESRDEVGQLDGLIGHHLAEAYTYQAELRHVDSHTLGLALRSAQFSVADSQRALRIGDRSAAEKMTTRIVSLLSACGPEVGSTDLTLMEKTAKLLVTMGRWNEAVTLLSPYVAFGHGPLLRDLGVALCQLHHSRPNSPEYQEGQRLLERAGAHPNRDIDALASLAGTWKGIDDKCALALYRQCLDLDPSDPYALGNVLEYEIAAAGDLSMVYDLRDQIREARRRCRSQADEGTNLPWAFFDAGKFALLLGDPYLAIDSYAKAVQLATADHMLATSLASLDRLERLGETILGWNWCRGLLALGRAVRFSTPVPVAVFDNVSPLPEVNGDCRVLMLAGGTDAMADEWLQRHDTTIIKSFQRFEGVIISGGTVQGIAGTAGSLRHQYGEQITAIGYLPSELPDDATLDSRYDHLRRTSSGSFSIAESLQAWADLLASGCEPSRVKLLAVNGGTIARAEYLVALSLGAGVGVMAGSGREADRLLDDRDWLALPNLIRLDLDAQEISRFLCDEV